MYKRQGQTGRSFKLRYKEHIPSSKSNITRSTFAEHLSSYNHNIKSINDNLDILHKCKKSLKLDTLERFEIYKAIKKDHNRVLNEKAIYNNNVLFNRIDLMEREIGYIRSKN